MTVAQTRSLSSMLLSALMMAAFRSGNHQVIEMLKDSPERVQSIIQNSEGKVKALMEGKRYHNVFFLGGGPLYSIAQEAGLKCLEMSTTDTFSYTFLESRHGPRAIIDENSLVVGLYSRGGLKYEAAVMDELTTHHRATTLAVTPENGWDSGKVTETVSAGCDWPDGLIGLAYLPIVQLVAYYCALSRGTNPDVARFHAPYVEIKRF
jgi:glucosamine--fructose-6-phosphate aminotransferase (isomerizing)